MEAAHALETAGLRPAIMVDCSHANSEKDHLRQTGVARELGRQVAAGSRAVFGVMIESFLCEGRQDVQPGAVLNYGQSITDACLSWEQTEPILAELADAVVRRRGRSA
jgi:3-deoxy-7-phosphoheptulonate synthase